ncbi:hypothetical protein [Pseudomonas sp. UV AK001]|uniref:hypothetical protein n=1 Tax=Pseudomonas sp. UV AK001 TaxID=3384791 RepID=UPI0038D3E975
MDALIHRFSCLSLLIVALVLSGCQNPPKPQTLPDFDAMGRKEFETAITGQPEPDSIVREGDHVTYMVMRVEGKRIHLVRFDADCHLPDAQMAYLTTAGMLQLTADGHGRTPEGRQLPAEQKALFLQSNQLKQVCAQVSASQWQVVTAPEHQDWQMIDRASLTQKDGHTLFWSSRVPPAEELMPTPSKSLFARERQRWSADCAQQRLTPLSTFYLDKQSRVIGGLLERQPVALQNLNADQRQLLTLACGPRQALDQYKPFLGREQTAFILPDPVLPASVVKAIEGLKLPAPEKNIRHLRLSFKETYEEPEPDIFNGIDLSYLNTRIQNELGRLGRDSTYLAHEPGKQLTERFEGEISQSVSLSFRGLTRLAKIDYTNDHKRITVKTDAITDLRFEGDWANMPVGTHLSYTVQRSHIPFNKVPELTDRRIECEVKSQESASEFYSTLTGIAKVIDCTGKDYHYGQNTTTYAYLQTYGMFVPINIKQGGSFGQFRIEMAE